MADAPENSSSGSNDRATVALVNAKLDTVLAKVEGHAKLTEQGFEDTQRQLDSLSGLPQVVTGVIKHAEQQDKRLDALEKRLEKGHEWRIGTLPLTLIAALSLAIAIITLVATLS